MVDKSWDTVIWSSKIIIQIEAYATCNRRMFEHKIMTSDDDNDDDGDGDDDDDVDDNDDDDKDVYGGGCDNEMMMES